MHTDLPDRDAPGQVAQGTEAAGTVAAGTVVADTARPGRRGRYLKAAALVAGLVVAFWANLLLSRTNAGNSDGAAQVMQGWQMLHGHVRLHDWLTGDVNFGTTEVPEYAAVEAVRGLRPDVIHVAAALTYVISLVLAALIAKGDARGRAAVGRSAMAVGIMIAPQLDAGTYTVLNSPDHFGTAVPVLLAWLILDRWPRRWWSAVAVAAILAWTGLADETLLFIGALPLVVTCGFRVVRALAGRALAARAPARQERVAGEQPAVLRSDIVLAAAGVVATILTLAGPHILAAIGGPLEAAPSTQLSPLHMIFWHNLRVTGWCLLILAGADFVGVHPAIRAGFEMLHLVGAALGALAIIVGVVRYLRDKDLVTQLLVAGIIFNLLSFAAGTHSVEDTFAREISPVLTLGAALAGRLLGGRLLAEGTLARWLTPVLSLVLCGYLAGLAYEASRPAVPAQSQQLASWLEAHHFRYGLAGYWQASIVTVETGGQVEVRPITPVLGKSDKFRTVAKQSLESWYDPRHNYANFVVLYPGHPGAEPFTGYTGVGAFNSTRDMLATFGKPARVYHDGQYAIYVWNKNLLTDLPWVQPVNLP
ncbi:MAG: hypothetical protein JWM19_2653 [Actinomycetia bacterium]|nr:hypothetical protein [Actinomycetes bacterium]